MSWIPVACVIAQAVCTLIAVGFMVAAVSAKNYEVKFLRMITLFVFLVVGQLFGFGFKVTRSMMDKPVAVEAEP